MVVANSHVPPWEPSPEIFLKEKKRQRKEGRQRQRNLTSDTSKARNPIKSLSLQDDDHPLVEHYQASTCRENASYKTTTTTSTDSITDRGGTRGGELPFTGINLNNAPKKNSQDNDTYYLGQAAAACEQCFEEGKNQAIQHPHARSYFKKAVQHKNCFYYYQPSYSSVIERCCETVLQSRLLSVLL